MMHHVAIMKKQWGLCEKILRGEKTVESRWYKSKRDPWGKIKPGDVVFFKDSGAPVTVKAEVEKVLQIEDLTPQKTIDILTKYGRADLGASEIMPQIKEYVKDKRYCILVFLKNAQKVKPFRINKAGFGAMSAWLCVDDVNKVKVE